MIDSTYKPIRLLDVRDDIIRKLALSGWEPSEIVIIMNRNKSTISRVLNKGKRSKLKAS